MFKPVQLKTWYNYVLICSLVVLVFELYRLERSCTWTTKLKKLVVPYIKYNFISCTTYLRVHTMSQMLFIIYFVYFSRNNVAKQVNNHYMPYTFKVC